MTSISGVDPEDVIVYTAILGYYDQIRPIFPGSKARHILFSDVGPKNSKGWEIAPLYGIRQPQLMSRKCKILAHRHFPDATYTIWYDGWVQMCIDPLELIQYLQGNDWAAERHADRDCIYREARACITLGHVNPTITWSQMNAYAVDGFPEHYGLLGNHIIVRKNTAQIAELEELWWAQLQKYTIRDQLSLMYCLWKLNISYGVIPRTGTYYKTFNHSR